ncbi:STAS domain-containing protein [Candidatus Chloroploca sp. M-50]|uniref:Anti-sigma factor antagonist n=1 Tax=Candidatus Chloroploca mongolica TaxID=2528176 RepID=A0ABS4DC05_9CHLR|nr:STAS domain-containing protein [Candidatus Chloroploca mongolica]MBP1466975.1 STAS domain-containing protein [Candidatus Chloroploca mongolica]
MEITITTRNQLTLATLVGELDGKTAPTAQERIVPLCQGGSRVLLDMSQVTYMSSAGLRLMLLLYRQATGTGATLALAGLSEDLQDTMSATGFLTYFTVYDTVEAAEAALGQ